jgi:hypothetical protein
MELAQDYVQSYAIVSVVMNLQVLWKESCTHMLYVWTEDTDLQG